MHFDTFKCQKNLAKDILANAKVAVIQDTVLGSQPVKHMQIWRGLLLYTISVALGIMFQVYKYSKFELRPSLSGIQPVPRLTLLPSDCRFFKSLYPLVSMTWQNNKNFKPRIYVECPPGLGVISYNSASPESTAIAWFQALWGLDHSLNSLHMLGGIQLF